VAACDEALRISPEYADALDSRAIARVLLAQQTGSRDYAAAIADFRRAIELAPGGNLELFVEERQQFLERLERGEYPFTPELIQRFRDEGY
jgi:tetratricopeptide (TPR) repeat protein